MTRDTLTDLTAHLERRIEYRKEALISEAEGVIEKMQDLTRRLKTGQPPNSLGELQIAGTFNAACGELAQLMQAVGEMKGWANADVRKK